MERGLKILYATEGEDFVAVQDLAEEEEVVDDQEDVERHEEDGAPPLAEVDSAEVAVPAPVQKKEDEDANDDEETF